MRFDATARTFEVSVRELAENESRHRIGFSGGEMWNRFGLGAEIHTRILAERRRLHPEYRAEVHLQVKIPVGEWIATLTGRLDGCVLEADGHWLIEEFKSTCISAEELHMQPGFERHRCQLLIYCQLWRLLGHEPVRGKLVYVDIATGGESEMTLLCGAAELEQNLRSRLKAFLENWQAAEIVRAKKAAAAEHLPFPHSAPRPGQRRLIEAIRAAVQQREHLLAEAPTGSGKTAASLFPAVREGLASGKQVVFLTAKTLQQQMAVNVLKTLNHDGAFRTLQMRSKEKMCANGQVICHEDFCPYARNYPQKMERSKILERLAETQTHHDPEMIFTEAKREEVCPFEVQLELAGGADAIVADYNYVFEPGVALKHLEDLENAILVVDEAHNLPERVRKIFSPELREETISAALKHLREIAREFSEKKTSKGFVTDKRVKKSPGTQQFFLSFEGRENNGGGSPLLYSALEQQLENARSLLEECAANLPVGGSIAEIEPPREKWRALWKEWEPHFVHYLIWKREHKLAQPDDPMVEFHFTLQRFVAMLNFLGPGFTSVIEKTSDLSLRLALVCLDPARPLTPLFHSAHATILLSATLNPAETTRRMLGLETNRTMTLSLPPPFPRENRKVLILPQARTTFAARARNFPKIAALIGEMADAVPGNTLVLFPSYEFLTQTAAILSPTRACLMTQRPNISDVERQKILSALTSPPSGGVLLFAVMGGMYAEGVDYPGEVLSGVFVVSPGLPQISFERELLRRYFDETEQAGFDYAYLQPGMTRVIQAAGRLIRNETDRGVIALICQRFLQEPYANYLPRDWYDESPMELVAKNPAAVIAEFFSK